MEETPTKDTEPISYLEEISLMMHGFGDCPTPNPETVKLVESVVKKQLREMLCEILTKDKDRSYKIINSEDLIFYLRYNKHKIQRLMKYLQFKYIDGKVTKKIETDSELAGTSKKKNLYITLKEFLESIDETGELTDTSTFDAVKYARNIRAERISLSLDEEKYMEYAKARSVSFNKKWNQTQSTKKFNKWIDPDNNFNLKNGAVEILSFLAYGIVANITDTALIIRENNAYSASDPLQMKVGHYHNSMMFNVPHISGYSRVNDTIYVNKGQLPITVNEVYEVIRRCYMPQVGYMRFSHKSILGKRKIFY